ncbi:right-handed parallel beta-helix repeat-containing protein [Actinoplanes aureus]|uniref:Right handed beta helix domain-containing protein n=1 Tax=Actinoplanes aureus TaxID=2792083 RepID=A0A931CD32_9ACTN|nr:right-handed parallel beta-helix repeat-containing protein [Actinoplanes aureus]MBG0563928.1 hypothetical protein [Actinoplanes aureus]
MRTVDRGRRWIVAAVAVLVAATAGTAIVLTSGDRDGDGTAAVSDPSQPAAPSPAPDSPSGTPTPSPSAVTSLGPATATSAKPSAKASAKRKATPAKASFPGAGNTGVPAGVKLKPMTGELIVKKAGTVIDGIDLVGRLSVQADNVTVRRSRITAPPDLPNKGRDEFTVIQQSTSAKGLRMEDCEIDGSQIVYRAIMAFSGLHVSRCELRNVGHGVEVGENYTVEDSWIHSTTDGPDDDWHVDGIISGVGKNGLIRHNTIVLTGGSLTGAVSIGSSLGAIDNVVIRDNLLAGGNYCVYIEDQEHPATRIQVIDNWFSTMENPKVGVYGIWYQSDLPKDLVRRGNRVLETGVPADDEPDWG